MAVFDCLPDELIAFLLEILRATDPGDYAAFLSTCRRFWQIHKRLSGASRIKIPYGFGLNSVSRVKWMLSRHDHQTWACRFTYRPALLESLYRWGDLSVMQFVRAADYPIRPSPQHLTWITSDGRLDVLQWFYDVGWLNDQDQYHVFEVAITHGHIHIVDWARTKGLSLDQLLPPPLWIDRQQYWASPCKLAAENGQIELLKWLCGHGCKADWDTCRTLIDFNHLDVLVWLRDRNMISEYGLTNLCQHGVLYCPDRAQCFNLLLRTARKS